jgi:hypothetical protein
MLPGERGNAENPATAVMRWERVPPIRLFETNIAALLRDPPENSTAHVVGDSHYVRVQVLTPTGVHIRTRRFGVVKALK